MQLNMKITNSPIKKWVEEPEGVGLPTKALGGLGMPVAEAWRVGRGNEASAPGLAPGCELAQLSCSLAEATRTQGTRSSLSSVLESPGPDDLMTGSAEVKPSPCTRQQGPRRRRLHRSPRRPVHHLSDTRAASAPL